MIEGSRDRGIEGWRDRGIAIEGSSEWIEGSRDRLGSTDRRIDGSTDRWIEGSDRQIDGLRNDGSTDRGMEGSMDRQFDVTTDLRIDGWTD